MSEDSSFIKIYLDFSYLLSFELHFVIKANYFISSSIYQSESKSNEVNRG